MTTIRLMFRQHRFEAIAVIAAALAVAGSALLVATLLGQNAAPQHCIEDRFLDPVPADCGTTARFLDINEDYAGKVMAALGVLPFASGAILGVVLVGSEIDSRTAVLAWSLAPSRRRWLLIRVAIVLSVLSAALAFPAIAAEVLERARDPWHSPGSMTLVDYGLRGPLVVLRGLGAAGLGLVIGALIGRVLPALIVTAIGCLALLQLLGAWQAAGMPSPEIQPLAVLASSSQYYVDFGEAGYRDRAGHMVEKETVAALWAAVEGSATAPPGEDPFTVWLAANFEPMERVVAGERFQILAFREAVLLSALTVAFVTVTVIIVERRRPV